MMKREHVDEYYTAYLEGRLPEPLRQQVETHLRHCARCAAALRDQRMLLEELRALPAEMALPNGFAARIRARVPSPRRQAPRWLAPAISFGALAAASLLLLLGFLTHPAHHPIVSIPNAPVVMQAKPGPMVATTPSATQSHISTITTATPDPFKKVISSTHREQRVLVASLPQAPMPPMPMVTSSARPTRSAKVELALAPSTVTCDDVGDARNRPTLATRMDGSVAGHSVYDNDAASCDKNSPYGISNTKSPYGTSPYGVIAPTPTCAPTATALPVTPNISCAPGTAPPVVAFAPAPTADNASVSANGMNMSLNVPARLICPPARSTGALAQSQAHALFACPAPGGYASGSVKLSAAQGMPAMEAAFAAGQPDVLSNCQPLHAANLDVAIPKQSAPGKDSLQSASQQILLRVSGRAHAAMTFNYIDPPDAAATQIKLPARSSIVALRLRSLPQGSVVRFSIAGAHQHDSFYLFTPGVSVPQPGIMPRVMSDLMLHALHPLANALGAFVLCPADLAERHITFIAGGIDPRAALRELAAQEHLTLEQHGQLWNITPDAK